MTITLAWERKLGRYSEIVLCSDSRLTGGGNIDVCQKIFPLPRGDAAVGFCGSTLIAYPIINQFISYVSHYKKNLDRALDGTQLSRRLAELANKFLESYIDPVDLRTELLETSFIIAVFSWKLQRPIINKIVYDGGPKRYVAASSSFPKTRSDSLHKKAGQFAFIGDIGNHYFDTLGTLIDYDTSTQFDMEPFLALAEMLRNPAFVDRKAVLKGPIGGTPQLFKIYPYLKTLEIAVRWPNAASGKLFLNGREIFNFEKIMVPEIDAETLETFFPLAELDPAGYFRGAADMVAVSRIADDDA
jgi:hypothetical protein